PECERLSERVPRPRNLEGNTEAPRVVRSSSGPRRSAADCGDGERLKRQQIERENPINKPDSRERCRGERGGRRYDPAVDRPAPPGRRNAAVTSKTAMNNR